MYLNIVGIIYKGLFVTSLKARHNIYRRRCINAAQSDAGSPPRRARQENSDASDERKQNM